MAVEDRPIADFPVTNSLERPSGSLPEDVTNEQAAPQIVQAGLAAAALKVTPIETLVDSPETVELEKADAQDLEGDVSAEARDVPIGNEDDTDEELIEFGELLFDLMRYEETLRDAHPTFKVLYREELDVIVFHDRMPDEDTAEPVRVAFSLADPERREILADEWPSGSNWLGDDDEDVSPTSEFPLRLPDILRELEKVAPEDPVIFFEKPEEKAESDEPPTMPTLFLTADSDSAAIRSVTVREKTGLASYRVYATEEKRLVTAEVEGEDAPRTLVERPYSEKYLAGWNSYVRAGMPVVPEVLVTENSLLVTDVKAEGAEVYGKALYGVLVGGMDERDRPRPEIDPLFLELMQNQRDDVIRMARDYAEQAARHSLVLAYDDPFELIVHSDGSWG